MHIELAVVVDGANDLERISALLARSTEHTFTLSPCSSVSAMRTALENNEFITYCQPIVDTASKAIIAYETLIRWNRPAEIMILPGKFFSNLERLGVMWEVGKFALESEIRRHAQWVRRGYGNISVCVNVSASQFADAGFTNVVRNALDTYELPANLLSLELTEDLLINKCALTRRIFSELSSIGMRFSIDDFGSGHNTDNYLKNFPIATIKIDRSFTRLLHVQWIDRAIARSQINLARELVMQVIAKGGENHIDLAELERMQPHGLQGFLIGRPMPVDRFERDYVRRASKPPLAATA